MIRVDRNSVRRPPNLFPDSRPEDPAAIHAPGALAAIVELFHGKCAFCESEVGGISFSNTAVMRIGENGAHDTWDQVYLLCEMCDQSGRGRGETITPTSVIDPCSEDPRAHLDFLDNGTVVPKSDRGRATIDAFQLNRSGLIEARREEMQLTRLKFLMLMIDGSPADQLRELLIEDGPYRAAARAMIQRLAEGLGAQTPNFDRLG